jgi:predicted transcriptional regulator
MKIKKIFIGIKTLNDAFEEAGHVFNQTAVGKTPRQKRAVYFNNLREMRRVLTEKRLELLKTIKDRKPSSVYELAKILDRDLKNVLQDIAFLEELGIIGVKRTGEKKVPRFQYDRISFEVAI